MSTEVGSSSDGRNEDASMGNETHNYNGTVHYHNSTQTPDDDRGNGGRNQAGDHNGEGGNDDDHHNGNLRPNDQHNGEDENQPGNYDSQTLSSNYENGGRTALEGKGGFPVAIAVPAIVGGVLLIALLIVLICCCCKKKKLTSDKAVSVKSNEVKTLSGNSAQNLQEYPQVQNLNPGMNHDHYLEHQVGYPRKENVDYSRNAYPDL